MHMAYMSIRVKYICRYMLHDVYAWVCKSMDKYMSVYMFLYMNHIRGFTGEVKRQQG